MKGIDYPWPYLLGAGSLLKWFDQLAALAVLNLVPILPSNRFLLGRYNLSANGWLFVQFCGALIMKTAGVSMIAGNGPSELFRLGHEHFRILFTFININTLSSQSYFASLNWSRLTCAANKNSSRRNLKESNRELLLRRPIQAKRGIERDGTGGKDCSNLSHWTKYLCI